MNLFTLSLLDFRHRTTFYGPEDSPGGGGGGDDQAESQIDGGDGDGGDEDYGLESDDQGVVRGPAAARTPPDGPEGRSGADDQGGRREPDDSDRRFAELQSQLEAERQERIYLRGRLDALGEPKRDSRREPEPVKLSDEQQAVQAEMLAIFPHLKLLDRLATELFGDEEKPYKTLMDMARSAPELRKQQQAHWDGVADRACTNAVAAVSKLFTTDPTKPARFSKEQTDDIEDIFMRWIQRDQKRLDRYERQDPSLPDDFAKYYDQGYVTPHRRQTDAGEKARDDRRRRLPSGGQGTGPVGTPKKKLDLSNEDAVFDDAWDAVKAAQVG